MVKEMSLKMEFYIMMDKLKNLTLHYKAMWNNHFYMELFELKYLNFAWLTQNIVLSWITFMGAIYL